LRRQVAVQALMAASRQGLAAFHLGEKEPLADQRTGHGQQLRQPADSLYIRIEIQQRMAPVRSARYGPLLGWRHARIERIAKRAQPFCRDRSMEQGITVSMELGVVDHGFNDSVRSRLAF
jgi:hypothetical protein